MSYANLSPEELKIAKGIADFLSDIGFGYTLGAVGGSSHHFFKAFRHSPDGQRLLSGFQSARCNAPPCASTFAFWVGGVYPASEYALDFLRHKHDSWNSIIAGGFTGMVYNMRQGLARASKTGMLTAATVFSVEVLSFVNCKVAESLDQQIASGKKKTELARLQPMLDGAALWFKIHMGGDEEKKEDMGTLK